MAFRWLCVIVAWISLPVVFGLQTYNVIEVLPGTSNCTIGTDCGYPMSVCVLLNEVNITSGCYCYFGFYTLQGGTLSCYHTSQVGEICERANTHCLDPYSRCVPDGDNTGMSRCNCMPGYVEIVIPGTTSKVCARVLHQWIDPACKECEANDGICYNTDGNLTMGGCKCQTFRSGPDCAVIHVNVTCNFETFRMNVCYMPHDPAKDYTMMVDGTGNNHPACVGYFNDAMCPGPGSKFLSLPLQEIQRDRCATRLVWSGVSRKKFVNRIVVQKRASYMTIDDLVFEAFCSFETQASASFQALGVAVMETSVTGHHYFPALTFQLLTSLGNPIPDDTAIRLGDQIRLKVLLETDGAYTALRVVRCMASSEATIAASNAVTMPLIVDSCPVAGQNVFDSQNMWQPVNGNLSELQTGLLTMFKFGAGNSINIHCTVQLCTPGTLTECEPRNCTNWVYRRRKRSNDLMDTDSVEEASLSREVHWYDDDSRTKEAGKETHSATGGSFNYSIMLILLGCLLLVALVIVFVLCMLLRRRRRRLREADKRTLRMRRSVSTISNAPELYSPSCKLISRPSAPPPHHYYVDPSYSSYADPRHNWY